MNAHVDRSEFDAPHSEVARLERRQVNLPGFAVRKCGDTLKIVVVNLSYDGCCIKTDAELRKSETIRISVMGRGAIEAEVRWYSGGRAGIVFKSATGVSDPQRPRREDRISLSAEVITKRLGGARFRARAVDVSLEGCKIELVDRPRIGERMFVRFNLLEALPANVCWIEGPYAGFRFERPIHPAVFQLLLQHLRS